MKFDDTILGTVLLVFAVLVVSYAQTFPTLAGMSVGPDLFPTIIGSGIGACGLGLIATGLARRRAAGGGPWVGLAPWVRSPRLMGNALAVLVALVFYIFSSKPLGFHITAFVIVGAIMVKLGVSARAAAGFAVAVPLLIHYLFNDLLRVPLPWGVLAPIAW